MSKAPLLSDLTNMLTAATAINANWDAIQASFETTVSRDGSGPNQMEADFDLNNNDLLNVKDIDAAAIKVGGVDFLVAMQTIFDDYSALTQTVTVSILSPTGGGDGDIWFKVST